MQTVGILMVFVSVVAIAYILITHELMRRDKRKGKLQSHCGTCKYFDWNHNGKRYCTFFFKGAFPDSLCHRYEQKGGGHED